MVFVAEILADRICFSKYGERAFLNATTGIKDTSQASASVGGREKKRDGIKRAREAKR